jgi:hypothetical protein
MFVVMGGLSLQLLSVNHLFVNAERHRQQLGLPRAKDPVDQQELDERQRIAMMLAHHAIGKLPTRLRPR